MANMVIRPLPWPHEARPDVTTSIWLTISAALITVVGSVMSYQAGINYMPSILMFVAALLGLGAGMNMEDRLIARYDTPHDDDTHPPQLITLRAVRAIVLIIMGVAVFAMML